MKHPTIVIGCGWALSGKTTAMARASELLGIRHLDIDTSFRTPVFGQPPKKPSTPQEMQNEADEMLASYRIMSRAADEFLRLGRSLVVTATFSKPIYHTIFNQMIARHPEAHPYLVWIQPEPGADTEDNVNRLFTERGSRYESSVNTYERYVEVRGRFLTNAKPIIEKRSHLKALTWPVNTPEETVHQVVRYITD